MERVSVIGLGRLGLPLACVLASRGFRVIGVDVDEKVRESVTNCEPLFHEPGLPEMLRQSRSKLAVTDNVRTSVDLTDATIVIVGTPSTDRGDFSLEYVLGACVEIGTALRHKDVYHVVVISSTVNPGDCGGLIQGLLEAVSGKKVGRHFGLCYCPEFVALGNVIHGYLNPDFVLIGESDERAGNEVGKIYRQIVGEYSSVPFAHRSLVNAELAKIVLNNYIAMKLTFANGMAELCEHIPGADVDQVTTVLALDSRIGPKYLRGGAAFGGNCFPRDVVSIQEIARKVNVWLQLIETVGEVNAWHYNRLESIICDVPDAAKVGVLGLAFKPNTDVVTESIGMRLLAFSPVRENCIAYDPLVRVKQSVESAQECVDLSDVVVITIPYPEFRDVVFHKGQTVVDCWRMLDEEEVTSAGTEYIAIGRYRKER